jgi:hypothetical protein
MVEDIKKTENTYLSDMNEIVKTRFVRRSGSTSHLKIDYDEVVPITSVHGVKYEPNFNNRFVCNVPGIDAYLVKSVSIPKLIVDDNKLTSNEFIKVCYHDTIAPSTKQLIVETAKFLPNNSDMTIKHLDPVGGVISLSVFKNIKIKSILMLNNLDYQNSELAEIEIEISFDECIVEY